MHLANQVEEKSNGRIKVAIAGLSTAAARHKLNVISDHFVFAALLAVLGFQAPPLKTAFDQGEIALAEIFADRLGLASKRHNVDEAVG